MKITQQDNYVLSKKTFTTRSQPAHVPIPHVPIPCSLKKRFVLRSEMSIFRLAKRIPSSSLSGQSNRFVGRSIRGERKPFRWVFVSFLDGFWGPKRWQVCLRAGSLEKNWFPFGCREILKNIFILSYFLWTNSITLKILAFAARICKENVHNLTHYDPKQFWQWSQKIFKPWKFQLHA